MNITQKPVRSYPWYLRIIFHSQKKKYGKILDSGLMWARIPRLFAAVSFLFGVLDRKSSPLAPALRSLVTIRVSQVNWCPYCVDLNSAVLAERAGTTDKIKELEQWQSSDLFDETERLVLAYADAITYTDQQVSRELMFRLKSSFSEEAIIELTGLIAFQNLSSKFNAALDIEPQGFCHIPSQVKQAG